MENKLTCGDVDGEIVEAVTNAEDNEEGENSVGFFPQQNANVRLLEGFDKSGAALGSSMKARNLAAAWRPLLDQALTTSYYPT
jgi:hypothetical protein